MPRKLLVIFFLIFGAFGLWGQEDADKPARDARLREMWRQDQARVAAEIAKNQKDQADLIQQNLARTEAAVRESGARTEAAVQRSLSQTNTWGGGGRAAIPAYTVTQEGVVAMAERISLTDEIFKTAISCAEKLGKEALKICMDTAEKAFRANGNVARSARKAKPPAPGIFIPRW